LKPQWGHRQSSSWGDQEPLEDLAPILGLEGCTSFTASDLSALQEEGALVLEAFLKRPKRR
jgi:predicted HicB family RNase H-like nuclease